MGLHPLDHHHAPDELLRHHQLPGPSQLEATADTLNDPNPLVRPYESLRPQSKIGRAHV